MELFISRTRDSSFNSYLSFESISAGVSIASTFVVLVVVMSTTRISMQDEPTGVSINRATSFENKVGAMDLVAGEPLIKKKILNRFFMDLVAGESLIKERASARQWSSFKKDWFTRGESKTNRQLPSREENGSLSWLHLNFKAMLSSPLKRWGSMKRTGMCPRRKLILDGSNDANDEKLVESFREMLSLERQLPAKQDDYHTLLRFLRSRNFDLKKAKESFLEYLKWREEFGVDIIAKEFKFEDTVEVKRCYPHGYHGVDKYGRPVYIERIGMIDLNTFTQITSLDRLVKYHVLEQEKTQRWRYPACSIASEKHIASTTSILDVKNVGISNFSKPARYLFLEIQKIDSSYYPETLHRLFIVNAGPGFRVLWKTIKAFLEPRTLAKIQVLGSSYKNNLLEIIDPSNLPSFLGGSCSCSDYGGCLLSDKGPWNDPEIAERLQAVVDTEVEGNRMTSGVVNDRPSFSDTALNENQARLKDNIKIKDVYDISPLEGRIVGQFGENDPLVQSFDTALKVAKKKFEKLEDAIEDAKKVLEELSHHIEELRKEKMNHTGTLYAAVGLN